MVKAGLTLRIDAYTGSLCWQLVICLSQSVHQPVIVTLPASCFLSKSGLSGHHKSECNLGKFLQSKLIPARNRRIPQPTPRNPDLAGMLRYWTRPLWTHKYFKTAYCVVSKTKGSEWGTKQRTCRNILWHTSAVIDNQTNLVCDQSRNFPRDLIGINWSSDWSQSFQETKMKEIIKG